MRNTSTKLIALVVLGILSGPLHAAAFSSSFSPQQLIQLTSSNTITPTYSGWVFGSSAIGAAGASSTIQYNKNGVLGGNTGLVYTGTNVGISTSTPNSLLTIDGTAASAQTPLYIENGNVNNFYQGVIHNSNSGNNASALWLVCNDKSTINSGCPTYFGEFGINSSGFSQAAFTGEAGSDVFLNASDSNLDIETGSSTGPAAINFFTAGQGASNLRLKITASGLLGVGSTTPYAELSVHALAGSTNTTLFSIASSTSGATTTLYQFDNVSHETYGGPQPSAGTCGASPAIQSPSNDAVGTIKVGTGTVATCAVNFANAFARPPKCFLNLELNAATATVIYASTTATVLTIEDSASNIGGSFIDWECKTTR